MNKENKVTTEQRKETYVAPKAEIMRIELDQSILDAHVSATFDNDIAQGDENTFG